MGIRTFSVFSLGILAWMVMSTSYMLVLYWIMFVGLVVFLNVNNHKAKVNFKQLNILFFCYLLFIAAIRIITYTTTSDIRYLVNTVEHLLFSLVVSLVLYLVIKILDLFPHKTKLYKATIAAGVFYMLGILNEFYQNITVGKGALDFTKGAYIDLEVNVVGAVLFIILFWWVDRCRRMVITT